MSQKPRILIVDDEPAVLLTYTLILEQSGYLVDAVRTAEEAKTELRRKHFALVVCDLSLGSGSHRTGHGGLDVIDFARRRQPNVGAVLLTGFADKETTDEAAAKGIAVLFKPIDVSDLLRTIRPLAGGSAA